MFARLFVCVALLWACGSVCGALQEESVETAGDKFHRNVIRSAVKLAQEGTITRRDVVKLRVAMLSPAFREQAQDLAVVQMAASGDENVGTDVIPVDEDGKIIETAIDWDKLLALIEKLIPIILKLIDAFGAINDIQLYVDSAGNPIHALVTIGDNTFTLSV